MYANNRLEAINNQLRKPMIIGNFNATFGELTKLRIKPNSELTGSSESSLLLKEILIPL